MFPRTAACVFHRIPGSFPILQGRGVSTSRGLRFLIVDDHAAMRGILRDLLMSPKDEVWEAVDGSEAQSVYAQFRPDWVIMDVRMSPVNGIEATRQIIARDPQAHVVIVTQHDDADIERQAREAGALACLPKDNLQAVHRFVHGTHPAHP